MSVDSGKGATPYRINFTCSMPQDEATLSSNIAANDYPRITPSGPHKRSLAIVGGGPSIIDHIPELREWQGDIWAINRTPDYLASHGIASTLVSVDAADNADEFCNPSNVEAAIFSSWCAPSIVERYRDVFVFDMFPAVEHGIVGTTTTAGTMGIVALKLGYVDITFFGCEGSFTGRDHAYLHVDYPAQMIVRAGDRDYRTVPGFLLQSEEMANIIRRFSMVFRERSGGLLRALIHDPEWSIVAVSESLKDHLEEMNGAFGLYDKPYPFEEE